MWPCSVIVLPSWNFWKNCLKNMRQLKSHMQRHPHVYYMNLINIAEEIDSVSPDPSATLKLLQDLSYQFSHFWISRRGQGGQPGQSLSSAIENTWVLYHVLPVHVFTYVILRIHSISLILFHFPCISGRTITKTWCHTRFSSWLQPGVLWADPSMKLSW